MFPQDLGLPQLQDFGKVYSQFRCELPSVEQVSDPIRKQLVLSVIAIHYCSSRHILPDGLILQPMDYRCIPAPQSTPEHPRGRTTTEHFQYFETEATGKKFLGHLQIDLCAPALFQLVPFLPAFLLHAFCCSLPSPPPLRQLSPLSSSVTLHTYIYTLT